MNEQTTFKAGTLQMKDENGHVELEPKKGIKIFFYIAGPPLLFLMGYMLYAFTFKDEGGGTPQLFQVFMMIVSAIAFVGLAVSLPTFHTFKIIFDNNGIKQTGLFKKSIPYESIKKIVVRKGGLEVKGQGLLNRITLGNIYINFDKAHRYLAEKVKNREDIDFRGSEKYIRAFLERS